MAEEQRGSERERESEGEGRSGLVQKRRDET